MEYKLWNVARNVYSVHNSIQKYPALIFVFISGQKVQLSLVPNFLKSLADSYNHQQIPQCLRFEIERQNGDINYKVERP